MVTLHELLTQKHFRNLDEKKLDEVINYELSFDDFNQLDGEYSHDKAKLLMEKWNTETEMKTLSAKQRAKIYRKAAETVSVKPKDILVNSCDVPEMFLFTNHGYGEHYMYSKEGVGVRQTALLLAAEIALNPIYK